MGGGRERRLDLGRAHGVVDGELLDFFALKIGQFGAEFPVPGGEVGLDGPVFARHEFLDLLFALDDQPQRRTLHPAGREAAAHLFPQQRRQIEADQIVERAARLLRINKVERQRTRLLDGVLNGGLGDFVKLDAVHRLAVE